MSSVFGNVMPWSLVLVLLLYIWKQEVFPKFGKDTSTGYSLLKYIYFVIFTVINSTLTLYMVFGEVTCQIWCIELLQ